MAKHKLPKEGTVGAPSDELHMRWAAQHVASNPDTKFTEAYLDLARRGRDLPPTEVSHDDSNDKHSDNTDYRGYPKGRS
jgi:hypothetical protein